MNQNIITLRKNKNLDQSLVVLRRFQRGSGSGCKISINLVPESTRDAAGVLRRILAFLLSVVREVNSSISLERSFSLRAANVWSGTA